MINEDTNKIDPHKLVQEITKAALEKANQSTDTSLLPKRLNYSKYRVKQNISFKEVSDSNDIAEIVPDLIEATTTISKNDYRNKLLSSYLMTPSALTESCPILFCYGEPGTGKSAAGIIAAELNGCSTLQGETSTFAAIRNEVEKNRFNSSYFPPLEENFCLVIDDITSTLFEQVNILSIFKAGCYRKTDKISIASGERPGENKDFHCYSLKIISSVHPIHLVESYKELHRRMIPVLFTKSTEAPKIDHTLIDFTDIDLIFDAFWQDEANCLDYLDVLSSIHRRRKSIAKHCKAMSVDRVALLASICATAIYCDYFGSEIDFYNAVSSSWESCHDVGSKDGLEEIIEELIAQYTFSEANAQYIDHDKLRFSLAKLREKELTEVKMATVKLYLKRRGFKLVDIDGKKIWELSK